MKLTGDPKIEVKNAQSKEEAKEINRDTIEEAGIALDDEELDKASGGGGFYSNSPDLRLR
jgi:hypothetical protein